MEIIETKIKKWGNSYGVIIPSKIMSDQKIKENQNIKILILNDSQKVLKETFGSLKGKLKKTSQEMKDELRRELY